ncbi:MAG: hypothetical protein RR540_07810 [Oscillospiraceae bacterium]
MCNCECEGSKGFSPRMNTVDFNRICKENPCACGCDFGTEIFRKCCRNICCCQCCCGCGGSGSGCGGSRCGGGSGCGGSGCGGSGCGGSGCGGSRCGGGSGCGCDNDCDGI